AWLGVKPPALKFAALNEENTYRAFMLIVESHYRHYQYYSNMIIALAISYVSYFVYSYPGIPWTISVLFVALVVVLFKGSKDALMKYYERGESILGKQG
ncbi:MAG TPA: hypothetical protein VIR45_12530, partial [Kiloniellaceae bacterium]